MLGAKDIKKLGLGAPTRHPFTVEEDAKLLEIMTSLQVVNWEQVAARFNGRTSRQCRERWLNYLNPSIRTGPWTEFEDDLLLEKVNELGRCWSSIGKFFNGRSENDIKNRWYSHLRYRTVENDGKFKFVNDPSESLFPYRKTRKRVKISPQQNAIIVLEQHRRKQIVENNIQQQIQFPQQQIHHSQMQMIPVHPLVFATQETQPCLTQTLSFPQFQPQQFHQIQIQQPQYQQQPQFQPQQLQKKQKKIQQPKRIPQSQSQPQLYMQSQFQQPQFPKQNTFLPPPSALTQSSNENIKSEDLFLSDEDEIQSNDIPEPEYVDFWEPHIFDEATTEFSTTNQSELIGYSLY